MNDLAIVINNSNKNVSYKETIDAIIKSGFKNVFIQWYHKTDFEAEELQYIKEKGLNIIFAHLGYKDIHNIWINDNSGDEMIEMYKNDIKFCHENNIPLVVMHLIGSIIVPLSKVGLERIQKLIDYASKLNIKIAFENTKFKEYLDYVFDNIENPNMGLCFDSGHYHVFFKDEFDFDKYKNKIFAIHLHDNDQTDDLHLIPFDGTLNFKNIVNKLKECNYMGPVTLELCYKDRYLDLDVEEFYKKSYEAGQKIKKLFK